MKKVLLIGLYDSKLLGIRYLSSSLLVAGHHTDIAFLKTFNSHNTKEPTEVEYELLYSLIERLAPDVIGISVMCSFYLDIVRKITIDIKSRFKVPMLWGGAVVTLFPEKSLEYADIVFRGEGEDAVCELVNALDKGESYASIENIGYKDGDNAIVNPIRMLRQDLDALPFPDLGDGNKFYINNDTLNEFDPELRGYSYELTGSRGCPNQCSYCSTANIRRLHSGLGKFIRFRSPENVIEEIKQAAKAMPNLNLLRFWDEIFPWDEEWVKEFAELYKKEVNRPFEVWGHPRFTYSKNMELLVDAGLSKIVIGVQSGSPDVRKNIYKRNETQEHILECARILSDAKVPVVIYDFILDHPFETSKDLEETLQLCRSLKKPFTLQLHGLSFLPGTDIEDIAIEKGVKTREEIEREQSRSLSEQYRAMVWWRIGKGLTGDSEKIFWHSLIFISQFKHGERIIKRALKNEKLKKNPAPLLRIQRFYSLLFTYRMGFRKLMFMLGLKKR